MSSTRSKGGVNLTNFTDDPEKIGRNSNRRRSRNMADAGNEDPQCQKPEEHQEDETGDEDTAAPTVGCNRHHNHADSPVCSTLQSLGGL